MFSMYVTYNIAIFYNIKCNSNVYKELFLLLLHVPYRSQKCVRLEDHQGAQLLSTMLEQEAAEEEKFFYTTTSCDAGCWLHAMI